MAHGKNAASLYEDHDVAGFHRRLFLDVPEGLQRYGQHVAEPLGLRALLSVERVLDGQRVQAQLLGQLGQVALRGVCELDPGELAVAQAPQPREGRLADVVRQLALHLLRPARPLVVYDTFHPPHMLHQPTFMRPPPCGGRHQKPARVGAQTRV